MREAADWLGALRALASHTSLAMQPAIAAHESFAAKHWPELVFTLIGVLLPALGAALWSLFRVLRFHLNPARHPEKSLLGTWYVYHFSRQESKPLLRTERWMLKLTWRGKIGIKTADDQMKELKYRGSLGGTTSMHMTCRMHGALHHEEFYVRIIYPIPNAVNTTFGIKVGENFDHDAFATLYLFSRDPLSSTAATSRLRKKLERSVEANGILLHPGGAATAPGAAVAQPPA